MPLYEYECARCGRFELIKKFSDQPLLTCPTCGGEVQKLFSAPAIQFKGTGWYITDYARKSTGKGGESGGESKGGESKGGEGKGAEGKGAEGKGAESGGSTAKEGGSSSTETASKAESGTKTTSSTGSAKGSGGGGSTS